jgi:hypothetical protein
MKMKNTLASLGFSLLVILSVSFIYSCKKDHASANDMYNISATMSPSQETGTLTGSPTGSGTVSGTYDAATNSLQYNVAWTGLTGTASAGHFHGPALAGATAGPVVPFTLVNNGTSGTVSGTVTLTDAQETDLLAGKWYANIHTTTNGGGEIRGQVSAVHQ